ncbi:MAG: heterodisulfide reductase-related iron-sulfur binding cluster [Bacteroidales bacterium]|nr:heterodisulfide reductase-related iron-sulfur binding cluster [Bacteroidales bacterium]
MNQIEGKQKIWAEYQKEIGDDNFFFVRSCIRQSFFPGSEQTFLKIMREYLGKRVIEDYRHTTCTGIGYHSDIVKLPTIETVVARHFSLMAENGCENYVPSCVTSFGIYSEILDTWEHFPDEKERIAQFLKEATGRTLATPKNLAHTSDIIYKFRNEIAAKAKFKLVNKKTGQPLKVVEHIGCHYSKMFAKRSQGGQEFPHVLVGMIEAWGGEVIDYPERRHCCGFGFRQYLVMANRGYSVANSYKKFESMEPYHPDFIVANCPGCAMFMDKWQYTIGSMEGRTFDQEGKGIPVLTYEEMAGLVLGIDPWELGMQMHQIPVETLLDKMGVDYDPDKKFLGFNDEQLPKPPEIVFQRD